MKRSRLAASVALALGLLAAPLVAEAQPVPKIPRIGFLSPSSPTANPNQIEAFRRGLREHGYLEGSNIAIEYRWAGERFDQLPDLAAELVRLQVDVVVAVVSQASLAAKNSTHTIPIVMVGVSDPLGAGLVASLARPGGNVTGTSSQSADVAGKSLELLKEVVPTTRRVAVLWNPANPVHQAQMLRETETAARSLGVPLQRLAARDPQEIDRAFELMVRERAGALIVLADPVFGAHRTRIAALAVKGRLPSVSVTKAYAEAGGLIAYGSDLNELYRRAGAYVDKILRGAKPADLPVEQPTKFELVVNLTTAKALGRTIPQSVLSRADEIIR